MNEMKILFNAVVLLAVMVMAPLCAQDHASRTVEPRYFSVLIDDQGESLLVGQIEQIVYPDDGIAVSDIAEHWPEMVIKRKYDIVSTGSTDVRSLVVPGTPDDRLSKLMKPFQHPMTQQAIGQSNKKFIGHILLGSIARIGITMWKDERLSPIFVDYLTKYDDNQWYLMATIRASDVVAVLSDLALSTAQLELLDTEGYAWAGVGFSADGTRADAAPDSNCRLGVARSFFVDPVGRMPTLLNDRVTQLREMYANEETDGLKINGMWQGGEEWGSQAYILPAMIGDDFSIYGFASLPRCYVVAVRSDEGRDWVFVDKETLKFSMFPAVDQELGVESVVELRSRDLFLNRSFVERQIGQIAPQ